MDVEIAQRDDRCKHCSRERMFAFGFALVIIAIFVYVAYHSVNQQLYKDKLHRLEALTDELQKQIDALSTSDTTQNQLNADYTDYTNLLRKSNAADLGNAETVQMVQNERSNSMQSLLSGTLHDANNVRIKRDTTSRSRNRKERKERKKRTKGNKANKKNKSRKTISAIQFDGLQGQRINNEDKKDMSGLWQPTIQLGAKNIFDGSLTHRTGRVKIKEQGTYLLYAQMTLFGSNQEGYHIFEQRDGKSAKPIATCQVSRSELNPPSDDQCFTLRITQLEANSTIYVEEFENNSGVHYLETASYFGLVKLD